ncbi:MAG: YeeE/YedE thiosulfate transporter family protein [Novosphingobium sp.]
MMLTTGFAVALICAGLMGYAIQSGATCMVYAVSELIEKRRASRLVAMLEAGLWVAAALMLAALLQNDAVSLASYGASGMTVLGGVLLGLGAYVNGACVFGSVARLGSGEIGYLITPLGYFLGVKAILAAQTHLPGASTASLPLPLFLLVVLAVYAAFRAARITWGTLRRDRSADAPKLWNPHVATLVIGITFAVMLLAVGRWTYPELLSDLAAGNTGNTLWRIFLFAALLLGARLGGMRHGFAVWILPTAARIKACPIGGAMMGIGGALIPGGNDGLILIGLPFLMPYALLALATMITAIAVAMLGRDRWAKAAS